MKSIDFLEHGGGDLWIRHGGQMVRLPDPRAMHYQTILMCLQMRHVPKTPGMVEWKRRLVFDRWRAAYDLPEFQQARRLAYLVDNYRSALTSDLATRGLDLGDLWRDRRWTTLVDVIDRLPSHSWYGASVAQDEEHARMMAEAIAAKKASGETAAEDKGPSLTTWTPEVAKIHDVLNAIRHLEYTVAAVQVGKKAGQPPRPLPGPKTALEAALQRAEHERRRSAHEALVARVLPQKAAVKGQSHPPVH